VLKATVRHPGKGPAPNWLSSLFGGDSRDAAAANLLLTGGFQAPALASKVAHSCETSVRAHSAGPPWPAGDPLSQTPRSTASTGTRQASAHGQQNPCSGDHNRPRALCREPQDLAACDRASAPIAGSDRPRRRRHPATGKLSPGARLGYGPHKAEKSIRTSDRRYLSTGSRSSARVRSSALGRV
jgi:hypothetical protein